MGPTFADSTDTRATGILIDYAMRAWDIWDGTKFDAVIVCVSLQLYALLATDPHVSLKDTAAEGASMSNIIPMWPANTASPPPGGTHWVQAWWPHPPMSWRFLMRPEPVPQLTSIVWATTDVDAGKWSEDEAARLAEWIDGSPDGRGGALKVRAQEIPRPEEPQPPVTIRATPGW